MPFSKFEPDQEFPSETKSLLLQLQNVVGPFEYRPVEGRWCIRTIPKLESETPLAVLGKTIDAAAHRMMSVVRLID